MKEIEERNKRKCINKITVSKSLESRALMEDKYIQSHPSINPVRSKNQFSLVVARSNFGLSDSFIRRNIILGNPDFDFEAGPRGMDSGRERSRRISIGREVPSRLCRCERERERERG